MSKKLKVACLHGYGTNAKFLQRQMRSFRRAFQKQIQFVFLEGTFQAPKSFILDEKVISLIQGETRAWNPIINYKYNQVRYVQKVLEAMQKYFKDEQFDGLLGFSQGAVMVQLLVKLQHLGKLSWKGTKKLKFCILASGNHWNWQDLKIDNSEPIQLPSIHLISESDFLYRKSIFTVSQFKDPLVIHHPFGHTFPRLGKDQFSLIKQYIKMATSAKNQENKHQILLRSKL